MTEMLPCKHFLHCFLAHLLFKKNNNNWHQTLGQKVNNNKNQTNKYRKINSSIQKTTHADTMQQHTAGNSLLFCNERNKHKLPNTNWSHSIFLRRYYQNRFFCFCFFYKKVQATFQSCLRQQKSPLMFGVTALAYRSADGGAKPAARALFAMAPCKGKQARAHWHQANQNQTHAKQTKKKAQRRSKQNARTASKTNKTSEQLNQHN